MTVSAEVENVRSEMAAGFARIEGKLDAYIMSHAANHAAEQQAFSAHRLELAPAMHDLTGPPSHDSRIRDLEDARLQQQTVIRTLKAFLVVTTGGSILSAVAAGIAIWRALTP
jgi:hypothetical protein